MYTHISSPSFFILKSRQKNEGMLIEREGANPFSLKQTKKGNKDNSMNSVNEIKTSLFTGKQNLKIKIIKTIMKVFL